MLKSILAYIIVIVLGQFAFTVGTMVGSGLFGMIFYLLPTRVKMPSAGFLAGSLGSTAVIGFGYMMFWLFGVHFGLLALLAAILSMALPFYNDYKMHRDRKVSMQELYDSESEYVSNEAKAMVAFGTASILGNLAGIIFLSWYIFH